MGFGLCVDGALLQDKFGGSLALEKTGGGELLTGLLCQWIHPMVMICGAFLSTCGAGLQSLTGAPRLLQSIARDDLMPGMKRLAEGRGAGNEPTWAVLVTFCISFCAIMIANLDLVAPILTIFFLMCYLFVNVSTTICSLGNFDARRHLLLDPDHADFGDLCICRLLDCLLYLPCNCEMGRQEGVGRRDQGHVNVNCIACTRLVRQQCVGPH